MDVSISQIFKHDVQSILDTFTSLMDIRIALFSDAGEEVQVGYNKSWCSYCTRIRDDLSMDENCLAVDSKMMESAKNSGQVVSYICHGGMREVIIPLFLESSHVGFLMIGQFRNSDKLPESILSLWKRRHGNTDIEKDFLQTPSYSAGKTEKIIALFSLMSDYILSNHMIQLQGNKSFDDLLFYMKRNMARQFSLSDAAALLGKSVSGTAALFKEKTGKSFKQVQGEMKMVKAVELIRKRPRMQIQEIAGEVGFSDPLYFSRFFRKNTGISPILFQKQYF